MLSTELSTGQTLALRCLLIASVLLAWRLPAPGAEPETASNPAVQRAVAYLVREVPRWEKENNCFSCHNNGDAARALFAARGMDLDVPPKALAGTTDWLLRPLEWDDIKGKPGLSDTKLARIQYAAALTEAHLSGVVRNRETLLTAAEHLLPLQNEDGSWSVDVAGVLGSPATYGNTLATYMSRRTLAFAERDRFAAEIARADDWLQARESAATVDLAALVLALADRVGENETSGEAPVRVAAKLAEAVKLLVSSQGSLGGWGPYPNSPAEAFDTALALLALVRIPEAGAAARNTLPERIERGRDYLLSTQLAGGGWPETTRPSGFQSYAQHISTSGWATLALLKTADPE